MRHIPFTLVSGFKTNYHPIDVIFIQVARPGDSEKKYTSAIEYSTKIKVEFENGHALLKAFSFF